MPSNAQDVSLALAFAKITGLVITAKGGGHATSGSSSSDGGIVIDLGQLNSVVVDSINKTVKVGGGATWKDVDYEAAKYNLACVSGQVNRYAVTFI